MAYRSEGRVLCSGNSGRVASGRKAMAVAASCHVNVSGKKALPRVVFVSVYTKIRVGKVKLFQDVVSQSGHARAGGQDLLSARPVLGVDCSHRAACVKVSSHGDCFYGSSAAGNRGKKNVVLSFARHKISA